MSEIEDRLEKLEELIKIQAEAGNWDYCPYMFGLLNGMLLARYVFDDNDPEYPDSPDKWLEDVALLDKFNKSGVVIK